MISEFKGAYSFLSNFYPASVWYDGFLYGTAEHLFQSFKTDLASEVKLIQMCPGPADAKRQGAQITLRSDWSSVKLAFMYTTVLCKFCQNPVLTEMLLDTHPHKLVEGNTWHDNYWGDCSCTRCSSIDGENKLGVVLMRVRDLIV